MSVFITSLYQFTSRNTLICLDVKNSWMRHEFNSSGSQLYGLLHCFGQFIVTVYVPSLLDVVCSCYVSRELDEWRLDIEGLLTVSCVLLST